MDVSSRFASSGGGGSSDSDSSGGSDSDNDSSSPGGSDPFLEQSDDNEYRREVRRSSSRNRSSGGSDSSSSSSAEEEQPEPQPEVTQEQKDRTSRANQSASLSTTTLGTTGTNRSRMRERTQRANQSMSLSTTTLGTTGTNRSRTRERTERANQSRSLSTTTLGTSQGPKRKKKKKEKGSAEESDNSDGGFVNAVGDFFDGIAQESAEEITPHSTVALGEDSGGLEARARKERTFARDAESGFNDITSLRAPDAGEFAGMLFQGGEMLERGVGELAHGIEDASPTQGMGPKIGNEAIGSVPGNVVGGFVGGLGMAGGAVLQVGPSAAADIQTGIRRLQGEETDLTPSEEVGNVGLFANTAESQVEMVKERPASSAILFAAPAAEAAPKFVRGYREGAADVTIPYESITDASGASGDVSKFRTGTGESTSKALSEVKERAAQQPEEVSRNLGTEEALYHTTGEKLPSDLRVTEGGSELPGLWTAPDANSVGLRSTSFGGGKGRIASGLESLRPTRPDFSTTSDRVAVFKGDRIEAMSESAQGAAYEVRGPEGEAIGRGLGRGEAKSLASDVEGSTVAPDQTTSGYQFLTGEAEPGTAYVRPTGSRTPELEAIFRPETRFSEMATPERVNVRVGGREATIPESVSIGGREFGLPGGGRTLKFGGEELPMDFFERAPTEKVSDVSEAGTKSAREVTSSYSPVDSISSRGSRGTSVTSYSAAFAGVSAGGASSSTATDSISAPTESSVNIDFGESSVSESDLESSGYGSSPFSFGLSETGSNFDIGGSSTSVGEPSGSPSGTSSGSPPSGEPSPSGEPTEPWYPRDTPDSSTKKKKRRRGGDEKKPEERDVESSIEGVTSEFSVDFVNPLSGEVLKTDGESTLSIGGL